MENAIFLHSFCHCFLLYISSVHLFLIIPFISLFAHPVEFRRASSLWLKLGVSSRWNESGSRKPHTRQWQCSHKPCNWSGRLELVPCSQVEAMLMLGRQQNSSPPVPAKSFLYDVAKPSVIIFNNGTVFNPQMGSTWTEFKIIFCKILRNMHKRKK